MRPRSRPIILYTHTTQADHWKHRAASMRGPRSECKIASPPQPGELVANDLCLRRRAPEARRTEPSASAGTCPATSPIPHQPQCQRAWHSTAATDMAARGAVPYSATGPTSQLWVCEGAQPGRPPLRCWQTRSKGNPAFATRARGPFGMLPGSLEQHRALTCSQILMVRHSAAKTQRLHTPPMPVNLTDAAPSKAQAPSGQGKSLAHIIPAHLMGLLLPATGPCARAQPAKYLNSWPVTYDTDAPTLCVFRGSQK